jgi:hypothetical protein
MLKVSKVGILAAVVALCGVLASSAGAHEWHTNGDLSFSSTPAGATRLVIHPGGTLVACSASSGDGTLNGPTSTAFPWTNAATIRPTFSGCTVSGAAGYAVACGSAEFRAISYRGGHTFGTAGGGVTTGSAFVDCTLTIGATTCSTITGTVHGHYINPTVLPGGPGRLTVTPSALAVHKVGAGCAAVPAGTGTFGAPGAGSTVLDTTYVVDGPNAPYIYTTT